MKLLGLCCSFCISSSFLSLSLPLPSRLVFVCVSKSQPLHHYNRSRKLMFSDLVITVCLFTYVHGCVRACMCVSPKRFSLIIMNVRWFVLFNQTTCGIWNIWFFTVGIVFKTKIIASSIFHLNSYAHFTYLTGQDGRRCKKNT